MMANSAGGYESWFVSARDPASRRALWIRHTRHRPRQGPESAALWCTVVDRDRAQRPAVVKQVFAAFPPDAVAGAERFRGEAVLGDRTARWDLAVTSGEPPLRPLRPPVLYRAPLPRTKLEATVPDGLVTGMLSVDGDTLSVSGWRGTVGHNWGSEHADSWVWLHASGFGAATAGGWLELVLARIRVGRARSPWTAMGALSLAGRRFPLGGLGRRSRVDGYPGQLIADVPSPGARLRLRVTPGDMDAIAVTYADPSGGTRAVRHAALADLRTDLCIARVIVTWPCPAAAPTSTAPVRACPGLCRNRCPRAEPQPSPELGERQDVAVGIGEPGHLVPAWGRPDAVIVLVHAVVALEHDALVREPANGGRDAGDPPAEDGVAGGGGVGDRRHAEHGSVRVEHAREVVVLGYRQAERLLVECPGRLRSFAAAKATSSLDPSMAAPAGASMASVQRVVILGPGASGKSTLAVRLGQIAGLPVIELDQRFWRPGLAAAPPAEWAARQRELARQETWIMDGDLGPYDVLDVRLQAADTIIFLDFSRLSCAWRAVRRSRERADFWRWLWSYRRRSRPLIQQAIAAHADYADLHVLATPRAVKRFLAASALDSPSSLTGSSGSPGLHGGRRRQTETARRCQVSEVWLAAGKLVPAGDSSLA